jgi:hypothetical protein
VPAGEPQDCIGIVAGRKGEQERVLQGEPQAVERAIDGVRLDAGGFREGCLAATIVPIQHGL